MRQWQLQEAKAKLSLVVKSSQQAGPQEISVRGEPAVVVIAKADYDRLRKRRLSFVEFLRRSPLAGIDLDIDRDRTPARSVRL
jgi:prevent-host-death family protein